MIIRKGQFHTLANLKVALNRRSGVYLLVYNDFVQLLYVNGGLNFNKSFEHSLASSNVNGSISALNTKSIRELFFGQIAPFIESLPNTAAHSIRCGL